MKGDEQAVQASVVGNNGASRVTSKQCYLYALMTTCLCANVCLCACQASVVDELGIPVKFVGVGEGLQDLQPFDALSFVDALFPSK